MKQKTAHHDNVQKGKTVPTLRLLPIGAGAGSHGDEVLTCAYAPDSRFVLSGGWDGHLRLWDSQSGSQINQVSVGNKPVTACAVSPDGKQLLSGTLEGMLARWEAGTFQQASTFLAHTRPISAIAFGSSARTLVTASWDRNLILWRPGREGRTLAGHEDIVNGCAITPDDRLLLSWSHDHSVRLWELEGGRPLATLKGHGDRVLAGAVSPNGRWGATGGRDRAVKLWNLESQSILGSLPLGGEVRCCLFLLDGSSLVAGAAEGQVGIYSLPDLKEQWSLDTELAIQCGCLAPSGAQVALGAGDGRIHFVAVDGFDSAPILVPVTQTVRHTATKLQKLFGKSNAVVTFVGTCPVCGAGFVLPGGEPNVQAPCPQCRRQLRVSHVLPQQENNG